MIRRICHQAAPSIQELLRCPICYGIPRENVFQCVNGHAFCFSCCSKVNECPLCKVSFWTEVPGADGETKRIRALAIESILDAITFECPNKILGCRAIMKRQDMNHHLGNHCRYEYIHRHSDQIVQAVVDDEQPENSGAVASSSRVEMLRNVLYTVVAMLVFTFVFVFFVTIFVFTFYNVIVEAITVTSCYCYLEYN